MFKKLKEKITEEVKISPQRFAEFTQSVTEKLQNTPTNDDNVFSIGEDDANMSATSADHGFSSVNLVSPSQDRPRRNSNSSVASDVSFLPRYESGSMYHLQSDLDDSVSELEDNASTASSQLGHLSKEQIYSAFQKSQMRYHKYRGRYTDLARHYKDLEREVAKMKSVLVETQDKAIRRVTELKEQCGLEQKAKAHLESALRDELEERNIKIQTLQTKIGLLQGGNNSGLLIDIDNKENNTQTDLENLTKYLNEARKEIEVLNERTQEMKANAIVFQTKEQEYKTKIANLEKEIATFSEREKENNLKLAQNKMELHNELISKDTEMSNVKKDNENLRQKLDALNTENKSNNNVKMENLQSQNKKLIDKVENLTQKCNNLESELLKVEKYKIDIKELQEKEENLNKQLAESSNTKDQLSSEKEALEKVIDEMRTSYEENVKKLTEENAELTDTLKKTKEEFDKQISTIREDAKKGLLSLETKIREKLQQEHLEREEASKQEFLTKIEELSSNNHSLKEIQVQILEKDDTIKKLSQEIETLRNDLDNRVTDYYKLEKNHLELIEDSTKLRNTITTLEKELSGLDNTEEKIFRLEAHIATLQTEVTSLKDICEKKDRENVAITKESLNLQQELSRTAQKLRVLEEKDEAIHLESSESKLLELKVQKLEQEKKALLDEFEVERKMFNNMLENHKDLKEKQAIIEDLQIILERTRHEVQHVTENLEKEREKNVMLFDKKHNLEVQVTKLQEKVRIFEEKDEALSLEKSESGLLELKLQKLEAENKKLLESFELERLTFANELDDLKQDLSNIQEQSLIDQSVDETSEDLLKEKLHEIRRLAEAKEKDNVFLSQENLNLQQEKVKLSEKLRLVLEKLENVQMDGTESKLLELKVQKLEEENKQLLDEFEMERKMFNNLLENHQDVREKEVVIEQLEEILERQRKELITLKEHVDLEKQKNVDLQEKKLLLEGDLRKTNERIRILEEKDEAISLDKNECHLLEMKLQKLEEENRNLLDTFEQERKIFNKAYHEHARNETQLKNLLEENLQIKEVIKTGKQKIEELNGLLKTKAEDYKTVRDDNTKHLKTIEELKDKVQQQATYNESHASKLQNLRAENDQLKKEIEDKDKQVLELSKSIENLREITQKQTKEFNGLLERTQQLDSILEKMQIDSADTIKKEKERQNELTSKIEDLQQELARKTTEFVNLTKKLNELEKSYEEEKKEYRNKSEEVQTLKKKITELQAVEESYKMIGEEKQVVDDELLRLKVIENKYKDIENEKISLENKLKELESDFKSKQNEVVQKSKVTEQQCNILKEEKDGLLTELNTLRAKIEDLTIDNSELNAACAKARESDYILEQLKNQNEFLQTERDNLSKEISELSVRIGQISSDNKIIVEENQGLLHDNEELKIRLEFLDKEKDEFDETKTKLSEEKNTVARTLAEVQGQMDTLQKQYDQLVSDKSRTDSNEENLGRIQQDFYDIKQKCDGLFIENKNLKIEYAKLEEKCNDFDKVKKVLETQINELENQYTEILHEKQLLQDEIQELKISPVNVKQDAAASKLDELEILKQEKAFTSDAGSSNNGSKDEMEKRILILQDKLVQYKSLDLTNKSSIEFYENELQKMKNQNEKLNRKLDETLVTLNHCAELSSSTEVEYLKNVLYNYMLGKEGLVLARVIAAVCKFDPQQTENVLQREQQKQTLLGQLGLI